jgi:photosystem II stability/assembly factor-like uncharacterized protein
MRALIVAGCLAVVVALPGSAGAAVTTGDTGWAWANPLPQGRDLGAVTFVGARGVAVGEEGVIVRSEDGGATWSAAASGTEAGLTEVAMPDANTVYAGGGCVLRRSTDGGRTFQRVAFAVSESKCKSRLAQIAFPTPTLGYVILTDGTVLRTTNGGRSFTRRASLQIGSSVQQGGAADVVFTGPTTGVVATGIGVPAFLRTDDGAQTWTAINPGPEISLVSTLSFVTPLIGYAGGGAAHLAKTVDGGKTWTPLALAGAGIGPPRALHCVDANTCALIAEDGSGKGTLAAWTADGGATGTSFSTGVDLADLAFSSAMRVVAVGDAGATLASDDAGHTFTRVGGVVPGAFRDLRMVGTGNLFAFPSNGSLAGSTNAGQSWTALGAAPLGRVRDVSFADAAVGYMLSGSGALQRTDDGGASWGVLGSQVSGGRALLARAPDSLLVGTSRGVQRSTDAGATFAPAAGARRVVSAFDRAGSALLAIGPRALMISSNGSRWKELRVPAGAHIKSADFVSARVGYLVRTDGDVFRTANGGRSWKLLLGVGRDDIGRVSFGDARHGFLMLATDSGLGGVLRTSDGGRTWRPQVLGSQALAAVLAFGSEGGAALTRSTGELFATSTGGDAGTPVRLRIRVVSKRRVGRRTAVTVAGRLKPAAAGAGVSLTARIGGSWVRKFVKVSGRGGFRTTWRLRGAAAFVAQFRGAAGLRAAGTAPLRVQPVRHRLGRHKRR